MVVPLCAGVQHIGRLLQRASCDSEGGALTIDTGTQTPETTERGLAVLAGARNSPRAHRPGRWR